MSIIKVANTLFSSTKTIEKALKKCKSNDDIHVAPAYYKETLHFAKPVQIIGDDRQHVQLEGTIIIPSKSEVTFSNITFIPTAHIHIEGTAHFENCLFLGDHSNALISLANAHMTMKNCHLEGAKDVAIAAFKESHIAIENCTFHNNGKTHILLDHSNGSLSKCTLTESTHGLWLKNDASLICKHNVLEKQYGTQVIVQQSTYKDTNSRITNSVGNGIFASKQAYVDLLECYISEHVLPQLWIQDSEIHCQSTVIDNGQESALMIRNNSNAYLTLCDIKRHKVANIQLCLQSRLQLEQTNISDADGIGLQARDQSIVNINESTFLHNKMAQIFITDHSILSMSSSTISKGLQVGVIVENNSNCSIIQSTITEQLNSGLTIIDSESTLIDNTIANNNGNGVLVLNNSKASIEKNIFIGNKMPHLGGKNNAHLTIQHCQFNNGKAVYVVDQSDIRMDYCQLMDGDGVQIELNDFSKGTIMHCTIANGRTNALKIIRNSSAYISDTIIAKHQLPQIVANDSSFVIKNSEIIDGEKNGFIIENHAEAHIEDTFIARHRYPQIWVDLNSNVELMSVQITEGHESDIYLQNESNLLVVDSFIKNLSFTYNIQSINHSKIELQNTIIEHFSGDCFYTENNSEIVDVKDGNIENEKN